MATVSLTGQASAVSRAVANPLTLNVGGEIGTIPFADLPSPLDPSLLVWLNPGAAAPLQNYGFLGGTFAAGAVLGQTAPTFDANAFGTGVAGYQFVATAKTALKLALGEAFTSGGFLPITTIVVVSPTMPSTVFQNAIAIGAAAGGNIFCGTATGALDGPDCTPPGDNVHFAWSANYFDSENRADSPLDAGAPRAAGTYTVTQISDLNSTRLYVNGLLVAAANTTATGPQLSNQLAIGAAADADALFGIPAYFTGAIGSVLVFNRALSDLERTAYEASVVNTG